MKKSSLFPFYGREITTLIFCIVNLASFAQDSSHIKVLFLYGSKPLPAYKNEERKWFGGMLGGHVGIEGSQDSVLNFIPQGSFHLYAKKANRHSHYVIHDETGFWRVLGGNEDSVKKAVVTIPVTLQQKQLFDSIQSAYLQQTPYDYALLGMRCGAATYEVLAQLGILKQYSYKKTYTKIFYPKKLRRRLFAVAAKNGWAITRQDGSERRKWESD